MSHLTSETREVWVPVFYNKDDELLYEGADYIREEDAVAEAREHVALIAGGGTYQYAKIEHRIEPTYK